MGMVHMEGLNRQEAQVNPFPHIQWLLLNRGEAGWHAHQPALAHANYLRAPAFSE